MSNECKVCKGELKQLFTSFYCPLCDENPLSLVGHQPQTIIGEDFFMRDVEEKTVPIYNLDDCADADLDRLLDDLLLDIDDDNE